MEEDADGKDPAKRLVTNPGQFQRKPPSETTGKLNKRSPWQVLEAMKQNAKKLKTSAAREKEMHDALFGSDSENDDDTPTPAPAAASSSSSSR